MTKTDSGSATTRTNCRVWLRFSASVFSTPQTALVSPPPAVLCRWCGLCWIRVAGHQAVTGRSLVSAFPKSLLHARVTLRDTGTMRSCLINAAVSPAPVRRNFQFTSSTELPYNTDNLLCDRRVGNSSNAEIDTRLF
jgi:hypothetical protein